MCDFVFLTPSWAYFCSFLAFVWPLESKRCQKYASNRLVQVENQTYYPAMHFGHFEIPFAFVKSNFCFFDPFLVCFLLFFGPSKPLESICSQKYPSGCLFQVANHFYIQNMNFGHFQIPFGMTICDFVFLTPFLPYFCSFLAFVMAPRF